jgi:SHS2 domain-containing protein
VDRERLDPQPLSARSPAGYETVEHTADIGLRIWGRSLEELFQQAALGMVSLLVNRERVEARESREVTVVAADREEALVTFLQELLYLYEVQRFVACDVEIVEASAGGARARLRGEPRDRAKHEILTDIKAATYHDLSILCRKAPDGSTRWETVVIFDI